MFMNEKGSIFVLEADETFCDCCGVLWKKHSMTEDALTGKHLCAPCLAHGEQEECPIMRNLKQETSDEIVEPPDPAKFRADLLADVERLRTLPEASEEETDLLETILLTIDCYLSFFRTDEDHGLCEFDSII